MALINSNIQPAPQDAVPSPQTDPRIVQRIVTAAVTMLNDNQVEQHVISLIQGAGDPAQGLAAALVFIVQALVEKSKNMPMVALGQAMRQILQEIGKMAQAAKIVQATPQILQQAAQAAMQMLKQQSQVAPAPSAPAVAPSAPMAAPAQPQGA